MTHDPHAQAGHHDSGTLAHPLPLGLLAGVFAALLVLTFVTVAVTWVDLGVLNIWIALLIAVVKGGLVALYFMHLRYDSPLNGVVLVTALLFVALFIGGAITDSGEYQPNLEPPATVQPAP
ncbi:MAG TPA: cytochrome C oxidase subunit IV family protein [Phycisphaeraceae bacterium]